ncbi:MAG: FkbM family methyltransferase [Flavobacteriaceae bacterium]
MKYYILSRLTRVLLGKLRKYHQGDNQLLIFSQDYIGEEVVSFGAYEKYEIEIIKKALPFDFSNHTALDIGANIGTHALPLSRIFKKVICFEPHPFLFEVLKINTRGKGAFEYHKVGLYSENRTASLVVPKNNLGGGTLSFEGKGDYTVELKKGDNIIKEPFAFAKIDVEGQEAQVVSGMEELIAKYKPIICFEFIHKDPESLSIFKVLEKLGYQNFYIPHSKSLLPSAKRNRFFIDFLDGLIFKKTFQLKTLRSFTKNYYPLIFCDREDSAFRIKKEVIQK